MRGDDPTLAFRYRVLIIHLQIVCPACAGMIRGGEPARQDPKCLPRMRGDDPAD